MKKITKTEFLKLLSTQREFVEFDCRNFKLNNLTLNGKNFEKCLFSTIVNLRAYLEAFEGAALRALKEHNTLEPDFVDLINTDVRYYHAFAGKISCILISDKFIELNKNAQTYAQAYSKSHNGINPQQDPEFNVHNDPSFRMIENEFHRKRVIANGPRTLDLDVLDYEGQTSDDPHLIMPHPRIMERDFTVTPLLELEQVMIESYGRYVSPSIIGELGNNEQGDAAYGGFKLADGRRVVRDQIEYGKIVGKLLDRSKF